MGVLDGFEVMERPPHSKRSGNWDEVLEAFVESGNECMGRRYEDADELRRERGKAAYSAKKRFPQVQVRKFGETLVLVRKEKPE